MLECHNEAAAAADVSFVCGGPCRRFWRLQRPEDGQKHVIVCAKIPTFLRLQTACHEKLLACQQPELMVSAFVHGFCESVL